MTATNLKNCPQAIDRHGYEAAAWRRRIWNALYQLDTYEAKTSPIASPAFHCVRGTVALDALRLRDGLRPIGGYWLTGVELVETLNRETVNL